MDEFAGETHPPPLHQRWVSQKRKASSASSSLSCKSNWSMDPPENFSGEPLPAHKIRASLKREASPAPRSLSCKSNWSMDPPENFNGEPLPAHKIRASLKREASPAPSSLSCKINWSMDPPENFSGEPLSAHKIRILIEREASPAPSSVSCKSDSSMQHPVNISTRSEDFSSNERSSVESEEVSCDFCIGTFQRAMKSCLTCTASFCEIHARRHYTEEALRTHKLVDVTGDMEQNLCQMHHRALEFFCGTEKLRMCCLCAVQGHQGHQICELTKAEALEGFHVEALKHEKVDDQGEEQPLELKNATLQQNNSQLQRKILELKEMLKSHRKENFRLTEFIKEQKHLEQKNFSLNRKVIKLIQQNTQLWKCMTPAVVPTNRTASPRTLTLDPDTAHSSLILDPDGKKVQYGDSKTVPDHPWRFDEWRGVLSNEGFSSGRHFWLVELNTDWKVGVTRETADRKGFLTATPENGYWYLDYSHWLSFCAFTVPPTSLPGDSLPRVLGVCLDVDERWVTFYDAESRAHIYTFYNMTFTAGENIYPLFYTTDYEQALEIKM
ncbi:E3 ubiquitin-protein ligase TRIM39-like isoform X2 [Denticeps clupeoides]|uniref:B30.2/SPRY domain-containing protein n=1 Tax=Denticeps clupeoides TaxID=299321 RepID=A0AAY4CVI2_9TELE|nr:E3 ubiquitin-protein ligase TRIM39-like isoform X2 [Denticeps clupeoides]